MSHSEFTDEPIDDEPAPLNPTVLEDTNGRTEQHDDALAHEATNPLIYKSDNYSNDPIPSQFNEPSSPPHQKIGSDSLFIHSIVQQPQKESDGQNAYISYLIVTVSNNPVFGSDSFKVRRRFSDFHFLYNVLLHDFPACALPPLPDKQRLEYLKGDRFGGEFTLKRASSLSRFLQRISLHPILKKAKVYHAFLESHDWNSYRASLKVKGSIGDVSSATDGISEVFINAFKSTSAQSPEFVEIKERVEKLDENINKIDRIFNKVLKRYGDLEQDYYDFSTQVKRLAELEPELQMPFLKFSDGLNSLSLGFQSLKAFLDTEYIISLKDLEHYVGSVKALLKLKDQKQIDYEALTGYLNKSISDKSTLMSGGGSNFFTNKFEEIRGVNHDLARKQKINKLETRIETLTKGAEEAKNEFESFERQTLHEIQYFEKIKTVELKATLGDLAENNIQFYRDMIEKWTKIEKDLSE